MRTALWESMLTADASFKYFKHITQKYLRYDRNAKIFLAIMTSSTVGGWVGGAIAGVASIEWLAHVCSYGWKILSLFSAMIAVVLPIMKYEEKIKAASSLAGNWWKLKVEYDDLWRRFEDGEVTGRIEQEYKTAKDSEEKLVEQEIHLPEDKNFLRQAQQETRHAFRLV